MNNTLPIHERKGVVYLLRDPRTKEIRYIGKALDLKKRMRRHLNPKGSSCPRICWLKALKVLGLMPISEVIQTCSLHQIDKREIHWIHFYRKQGCRLTNFTNGGDGGATMTGKQNPCSEETRRKISQTKTGCRTTMTSEQRKTLGQKILASRIRNGTTNLGVRFSLSKASRLTMSKVAKKRAATKRGRAQILAAGFANPNHTFWKI